MGKSSSGKVTIKKYANRRLYDTESSTYITLDKLGMMIRDGRDFEVIDAKSGDDITHQVLTQIIVDEESRGSTLLPVNFLRQIIGLYGDSMQGMVPQYLEAAMEAFQRNQTAMRDALGTNVFADIAKRNMAVFTDPARAFGLPAAGLGAASSAANANGEEVSEVTKLRAELASLQAKVDKLAR